MAGSGSTSAVACGSDEFAVAVANHLRALTLDDVRVRLVGHARQLAPDARSSFCAMLGMAVPLTGPQPGGAPGDATLLDDIAAFAADVESGAFSDEYEQDDRGRWVAEAGGWAMDFDGLYRRAADRFAAGDRAGACEAYARLFGVLVAAEEDGLLYCEEGVEYELQTDLRGAMVRYLRARYDVTPRDHRVEAILEAIAAAPDAIWTEVGLQDLLQVDPEPPDDWPAFITAWVSAIAAASGLAKGKRDRLLTEATLLARGPDGLADFARGDGGAIEDVWFVVVRSYLEAGRSSEALSSAREAVPLVADAADRARMLEVIAGIATDDEALSLDAARRALRAEPTSDRLLRVLCWGSSSEAELRARASAELEEVPETLRPDPSNYWRTEASGAELRALIGMAIGRPDLVAASTSLAPLLGWSRGQWWAQLAFGWLLLVGANQQTEPEPETAIARILNHPCAAHADAAGMHLVAPGLYVPEPDRSWLSVALRGLATVDATDEVRAQCLVAAERMARDRVNAIVSNQHRGAYNRAAEAAAAYGEAIAHVHTATEGRAFVEQVRALYPRHSSFKNAIDAALRASPILRSHGVAHRPYRRGR